jgi:leucyl aminopeptidase
MAEGTRIDFAGFGPVEGGDLILLAGEDLRLSDAVVDRFGAGLSDLVARAAPVERFKGKRASALSIAAPASLPIDRLVVVGTGGEKERAELNWTQLGGAIAGRVSSRPATVVVDAPGLEASPRDVAEMALGARLRAYAFKRYKTKRKKDEEPEESPSRITFQVADPAATKRAARGGDAVAAGVLLARDLVNEPPNVLFPEEFARRAEDLRKLGVDVEVLDDKALRKLGMRAVLAVGQGSDRESRVVVMRWNGAKGAREPVAFIGKGVCFDTGGVSIKPAAGMEDMKGDMAGAACVTGLMRALAGRKAKVNALGVIGCVENMPDGKATRPGDIVTSLSGQTIEVINTDAEGRMVLADLLWHVQERYKPRFMIDLATLTGAILVALGQEYAGLFSNNDELAERLAAAGKTTGERVWRMPLGSEYDKLIDSKFADMKNTGGRNGGSITAAQFLQRFVNDTPWAHLDIAGMGMNAKDSDINRSWGPGWGVRLLDQLVRDHYEG